MKDALAVIGVTTMLAISLTLFMMFLIAYMSPSKAVRVHINNYGEADAEMIFLSAMLPLNIISTFIVAKRFTEKKEITATEERTVKDARRRGFRGAY